jgi:predicted AlkP superfamily pyrophosphatase or phosphodiesterase
VVVIVVDQMRIDYLSRYADQYSGGLARLNREGIAFTDAHHDHALTYTAPGHASLSTGVYPRKHGIVSNFWWTHDRRRTIYAVEDTVRVLGAPDVPGSSPSLLLREPLGSWLKRVHPESNVFSVSLKDRAAILMAGPDADAAYWLAEGRFVTSEWYLEAYPEWVTAFNEAALSQSSWPAAWDRLHPEASYGASREDDFPAEADGVRTTFPHLFEEEASAPAYHSGPWESPFGDERALAFARTLIAEEGLGDDATPDLLMISASAADVIGHAYGPYSQEVQDYYLRLDRMLQSFFETLDTTIGPDAYLVALTSDHGVLPMPEELQRRGVASKRIDPIHIAKTAVEAARRRLGLSDLPASVGEDIVLRFPGGFMSDSSLAVIRQAIADELLRREEVADVFTHEELVDRRTRRRPFLEQYRRSYHPERSPDLLVRYKEHYLPVASPTGTSHGGPYAYDTHIPMVFLSHAFRAARHARQVAAVDLAPTLATLMRIEAPDDLDGAVLREVIRATRLDPRLP